MKRVMTITLGLFFAASGCAGPGRSGLTLDVKEARSTRTGIFTALDSSVLCRGIAQTNGPPREATQKKSASVHEYRRDREGGYVFGPSYSEGTNVRLRDESRCRWDEGSRSYRPVRPSSYNRSLQYRDR